MTKSLLGQWKTLSFSSLPLTIYVDGRCSVACLLYLSAQRNWWLLVQTNLCLKQGYPPVISKNVIGQEHHVWAQSCIKTAKKNNFILPTRILPHMVHSAGLGENIQLGSFILGRKRGKCNMCPTFSFFWGAGVVVQGAVFVSLHKEDVDRTRILWLPGHSVQKTASCLNAGPENLQHCRQIPEGGRIVELPKKKRKSL